MSSRKVTWRDGGTRLLPNCRARHSMSSLWGVLRPLWGSERSWRARSSTSSGGLPPPSPLLLLERSIPDSTSSFSPETEGISGDATSDGGVGNVAECDGMRLCSVGFCSVRVGIAIGQLERRSGGDAIGVDRRRCSGRRGSLWRYSA